jgi:hypothetical protein
MPLVSGSSPGAFKQNVRTLMGEIGKSPHVQSREQALAIAYAKQRRGRAAGGGTPKVTILPPQTYEDYQSKLRGPARPLSIMGGQTDFQALKDQFDTGRRVGPVYGEAQGGAVGRAEGGSASGLVDHDSDPDLPRRQDPAQLIDMMPLPRGYEDPAYIQTIYRLLRQQQQLNEMYPQLNTMHPMVRRELLRRYWLGGYLGGYR